MQEKTTYVSFENFTKSYVFLVEESWGPKCDEELRAVGVSAFVSIANNTSTRVANDEVFVVEMFSVDAGTWGRAVRERVS